MRVKFLVPGNNGSVSFWSSYVSFRVYCFANPCDTLVLPRDGHHLSSVVVWERTNVIFIFNRGESYFVVMLIMLLSSCFSTLKQFLLRPRWFASFCSFWYLSYFTCVFLLAYHFKIRKTAFTTPIFPRNNSSPSKAFFRAR